MYMRDVYDKELSLTLRWRLCTGSSACSRQFPHDDMIEKLLILEDDDDH